MTLRTVLIVAVVALAGAAGFWIGARQAQLTLEDSDTGKTDEPLRLPDGTNPRIPSLPTSVPEAAADEAVAESIDDPKTALKKTLAVRDQDTRRHQLTRLGWVWGSTSPEEAWKRSGNVADSAARWQLQSAIVAAWANDEPERAFAHVAAMPASWQRDELLQLATTELARSDPRLALEMVAAVDVSQPQMFELLIANEWSKFDPAGAAQWVEALPRRRQARLAYQIADAFVAQQPGEALAWALRISRTPGRNLWSHMIGLLAQQNPQEALRIAKAAESPAQRSRAMAAALRTIAAQDPALAISYLEDIPAGPERAQTAVEIAFKMAETSPETALEWVASLSDRQARMMVIMNLSSRMAWEDVEAAAQLVDRVPQEARQHWIANVAEAYVEQDPAQAIQWVRQFESEATYESIVSQFASSLAMRDPEAAFELVEGATDGAQRDQMLVNILMSGAAQQSPETATRWVAKIADENSRAQAVANLTSHWAQYDATAARKWVLSQPAGMVRDGGLMQLAAYATSTADEALDLIDQIQSREQRMNAVLQTAARLSNTNPEEARVLLRRHPLDPQRQQQLEQMLQHQPRQRFR
jgi:DNA polymerase IIIc chi subunit